MQKYEYINQKISNEIIKILEQNSISLQDYTFIPTDPSINDKIMKIIAENTHSVLDRRMLYELNKDIRHDISSQYETIDYLSSDDYRISEIVGYYTKKLSDVFFTIDDNVATPTNIECFELPDMSDKYNKTINMEYIHQKLNSVTQQRKEEYNYKELCLLIAPDGKSYFSPSGHSELGLWLNVCGIDMSGFVRFESDDKYGNFRFSSLYQRYLSKYTNNERYIQLTKEQAIMLDRLYGTLSNEWKLEPMTESSAWFSDGFAFDKMAYNNLTEQTATDPSLLDLMNKNIQTLDRYCEYFDKNIYINNLKSTNNAFELLYNSKNN